MMTEMEEQKQFLRDMVEKLKEEKNQLVNNFGKKQGSVLMIDGSKANGQNNG